MSDTEILAISPPVMSAATVNVTVTTAGGTSTVVTGDEFTYEAMPTRYVVTTTDYDPTVPHSLADLINIAEAFNDPDAQITFDLPADSVITYDPDEAIPGNQYGPTAFPVEAGEGGVNITIDGCRAPGLVLSGTPTRGSST